MIKSLNGRWLTWAACGYLLFIAILLIVMHLAGDCFWLATMVLFGPRWFAGLPILAMLPLVFWRERLALVPLCIASVMVAWPLMGLTISFPAKKMEEKSGLRIMTCNTEMGNAKGLLDEVINAAKVDIVALQECSRTLPIKVSMGWNVIRKGELAIISRFPLRELEHVMAFHPPHKWPRYSALLVAVDSPAGDFELCTVHLPSPRYGLQHIMDRRTVFNLGRTGLFQEETIARADVSREVSSMVQKHHKPLVVAGDFNMPVESSIYRKNWVSFTNAFSANGFGYGYTERNAIRGISIAARIDHILTTNGAVPVLCEVGPDVGSDHLPLIADIVLGGVQEKAPSLGKSVMVVRETTERSEAVAAGTVRLVGTDQEKIVGNIMTPLAEGAEYDKMSLAHNPYGDGKAASRIVKEL